MGYLGWFLWLYLGTGQAHDFSEQITDSLKNLDHLNAQVQALHLKLDQKIKERDERLLDTPFVCQGRLTLQSNTPVPTSDLANQSTLYFTPYQGSRVALYTGSNWVIYTFTERSLALSGLTASTNYDVFLYNNSGTLTLELTAWSTGTVRVNGLVKQDGVYVRFGASTRRYLGTIRATSATQTQDTRTQRFVWNYYNRTKRTFALSETTDSWTYTTAAWQQVNANTANAVSYVTGENEVMVSLRAMVIMTAGAINRTNVSNGFGLDSTTTVLTNSGKGGSAYNVIRQQHWSEALEIANGLGFHTLNWIEYGAAGLTLYGDDAGDARTQSGVLGWILG